MTAPLREQFANKGRATLNGAINDTQTTIVVNTPDKPFPTTGNFRLLCDNEGMLCTARSGNTLTVVRGDEGDTPASHSDGANINHIVTDAGFNTWLRDSVPLAGDSSPAPPLNKLVAADGVTLLTTSDFAWTNQGGAAVTDQNGTIVLRAPASSGTDHRIFRRTAPSPPYTLIVGLRAHLQGINGSGCNPQLAIVARQSTSGKFYSFGFNRQSAAAMRFAVDTWNSATSFGGSTPFLGGNAVFHSNVTWLKLEDNNTNLLFSVSDDGVEWIQVLSQARGTFLTLNSGVTGPDQIGLTINNGGDASANDALLRLVHWSTQ